MPPQRAKKQPVSHPSGSLGSDMLASFPAPPANAPSVADTPAAWTPERTSPSKRSVAIVDTQKQALMDNLQLEITERARKLRAQYGLLAQGLRSRLEMRVNRIPTSLRKTNIMDLVEKYSEQPHAGPAAPSLSVNPKTTHATVQSKLLAAKASSPERTRGTKRPSNEIFASDKENAQQEEQHELAVPKKRVKTGNTNKGAPAANSRARTVSRQDQPLQVLSPKSNNSRTYPRSPLKIAEEDKLQKSPLKMAPITHTSPLKSSVVPGNDRPSSKASSRPNSRVAGKVAAGTARGKKAATSAAPKETRPRTSLASSNGSATDTSAGTTVVRKNKKAPTTAAAKKKTAAARSTGTTKSAAAKSTAAAKKGKENAPAGTERALRSRR